MTVFERGWLSSNNILFIGEHDTALVDTGYVTHAAQTLDLVAAALGERPLDRVLNTHLHSDHCGGNAALQRRYPALRTEIPPGDASAVAAWDVATLSYAATGQQCPRFGFDALLQPGSKCVLADLEWDVHGAPGHDPHSVILFEPHSGVLISADALWETGFGIAFPELVGEPSFGEISATFDLIESLAPRAVIPGHGRVFDDPGAALTIARRRLDGLAKAPIKHARHAMKVLIKFKLLEAQTLTQDAWMAWVTSTPYLELIRARFYAAESLQALCNDLLADLADSDAALLDGVLIHNVS